MTTSFKTKVASFGRQEDGSVAMIFGLTIMPLVLFCACSVDYARGIHQNQKLHDALDTATLAAARAVKDGIATDAEVTATALAFFKANTVSSYAVIDEANFKVDIDRANSKVELSVPAYVPTTFARAAGIDKMQIPQKNTAVFALRDIEVGLALDVTGSMRSRIAGKRKLDSLKSAFEKFADQMLPARPVPGQKVRLGLAPYAQAINLGPFASAASANRSTDCVTERHARIYTDASVAVGGSFDVKSDGTTSIDRKTYGQSSRDFCPSEVIMPLTSDRDALVNSVKAYDTNEGTAGHLGAQWAWNLVSPEWAGTWGGSSRPDGYDRVASKKLVKAVILMTDGEFNTAYHHEDSKVQAVKLCDAMKAKGVQVFSLIFGNEPDAVDTMKACASGPSNFVNATNEDELDAAFALFAGKINALRLAQ